MPDIPAAFALAIALASALALTLAVELPIAAIAFRFRGRELGVLALANLGTNPAMNVVLVLVMSLTGSRSLADPAALAAMIVLEILVVIAEWKIIAVALPSRRPSAPLISLALNAASFAVGLVVLWLR